MAKRERRLSKQLEDLCLYAWVGEDELGSGEIGLKQGMVPAGFIPLVATTREKIDRGAIESMLQVQSATYGKKISLVKFIFAEVLKETSGGQVM